MHRIKLVFDGTASTLLSVLSESRITSIVVAKEKRGVGEGACRQRGRRRRRIRKCLIDPAYRSMRTIVSNKYKKCMIKSILLVTFVG
jgi:hypothetical protein